MFTITNKWSGETQPNSVINMLNIIIIISSSRFIMIN